MVRTLKGAKAPAKSQDKTEAPPSGQLATVHRLKQPSLATGVSGARSRDELGAPLSKRDRIIHLYKGHVTDIAEIGNRVGARPSYVAQVLRREGLLQNYFDLYTHTSEEQNAYSRSFQEALSFRTPEAAGQSVRRIDELYRHYERLGDRAGQHQAMLVALTGLNRARWSGKVAEAEIFREWLTRRLELSDPVSKHPREKERRT